MMQLEWRRQPEPGFEGPEWSRLGPIEAGREVVIDNLTDGDSYEVRVREVYPDGTVSAWTVAEPATAGIGARPAEDGTENQPPPVQNVRIEGDDCLVWDPPPDAPLDGREIIGYEVRHASDDYREHDAATDISSGLVAAPPIPLCGVPRGLRTVSVVPVYKSGTKGDPTYMPVDRGDHDDAEEVSIESHNEHTSWTGTKSNFTPSAGTLTQDASTEFFGAAHEPFFGPPDAEIFAGRYAEASYEFNATPANDPAGADDGRVLTVDISASAPNWRLEYRRDDTRFFGPDNEEFFDPDPNDFFTGSTVADDFFGADSAEFFGVLGVPFFENIPWLPWPGRMPIRLRETLKMRVVFPGGSRPQGVLNTLTWKVTRPPALGVDIPQMANGVILHTQLPQNGTHLLYEAAVTQVAFPAGATEFPNTQHLKLDLTVTNGVRCVGQVGAAGPPGSVFRIEYSTDEASWAALTSSAPLGGTGTQVSSWAAVPAGARGDVYIRAVTASGNGIDSATIKMVGLQVR